MVIPGNHNLNQIVDNTVYNYFGEDRAIFNYYYFFKFMNIYVHFYVLIAPLLVF